MSVKFLREIILICINWDVLLIQINNRSHDSYKGEQNAGARYPIAGNFCGMYIFRAPPIDQDKIFADDLECSQFSTKNTIK